MICEQCSIGNAHPEFTSEEDYHKHLFEAHGESKYAPKPKPEEKPEKPEDHSKRYR